MINLILLVISFIFWFIVFWFFSKKPKCKSEIINICVLTLVLVTPFNINGNIYTVLGSAHSDKSIYSIYSPYQKAEEVAASILGGFYQEAGIVITILGISGYQVSKEDSVTLVGIAGCQISEKMTATPVGISIYQKAHEEAKSIIGFTIYREVDGVKPAWFALFETKNPDYK